MKKIKIVNTSPLIDGAMVAKALGAERFCEIVAKLSPEQRVQAAAHFGVAASTVDRWVNETARPHPLLQRQIIRWIDGQTQAI